MNGMLPNKGQHMKHDIHAMGERAGALLKQRGERIAVGETSAGGLISASLLAVPGGLRPISPAARSPIRPAPFAASPASRSTT